jgi:hypothetical protein
MERLINTELDAGVKFDVAKVASAEHIDACGSRQSRARRQHGALWR